MSSEIKYLLPHKNFYKANLYARSNNSDGRLSPEELKNTYKSKGYSVLAITDDEPVNEKALSEEDFLVMSGFAFGAKSENTVPIKNAHFTALSLTEEPQRLSKFNGKYDLKNIASYISECKMHGYFTTYSYPAKSCLVMPEQLELSEVDALEVMNYSSLMEGQDEYNAVCYDNFLRRNHRLFCAANDGNKNLLPLDSKRSDSFGAYTYINSDSLDYTSIASSIKNGEFYASEGPEIKALWIKGDTVNIRTSPADRIFLCAGRRACRSFQANGGVPLTAASFQLHPKDIYVRFVVIDEEGRRAYTRAYYLDEMM